MLSSQWCFALAICLLVASPMLEAFDPLLIAGGFRGAGTQIRQGSIRILPLRGGGSRSGARITPSASAHHPITSLLRRRLNIGRSSKQASGDGSEAVSQTRQAWEIVKFAIPALSIPLCDPIMSCVDVVCIGQYGTTLELAALGPNVVIFNFVSYSFCFLSIATTLSVSRALAVKDRERAGRVVSTALWIGVIAGLAITASLLIYGQAALAATGAVPELVLAGQDYLRVRVLSSPATLGIMALQAGLLAQKDSFTPLLAILISGTFNVIGDIFLIRHMRMGVLGAAWATSAAQYVGVAVLLLFGYVGRKPAKGGVGSESIELSSRFPTKVEFEPFLSAMGPLFFLSICKNLVYLMIQAFSTTFSTATCAAHQAIWSSWAILSFCGTPLEQCAQVFLPRFLSAKSGTKSQLATEDRSEPGAEKEAFKFIQSLTTVASAMGVILGTIGFLIPLAPHFFTPDKSLYPIMRSFRPYMLLSLLTAPISISLDGVLMTLNDITYLIRCQVVNMLVLASFLFYSFRSGAGILSVWQGVVMFFGLRLIQNIGRILFRRRVA